MARFAITVLTAGCLSLAGGDGAAQTLRGIVIDRSNGQPIATARILMLTEQGDSVASAITDERGAFAVVAGAPGSYLLHAEALGYRAARAGTFDLGADGEISLEVRMRPNPLRVDEIAVRLNQPIRDHFLVQNGFVSRYEMGLGHFITPYQIEASHATTTEALLTGIPGVVIRPGGAFRSHLGDAVQMRGPGGGTCTPSFLVDGMPVNYDLDAGLNLSSIVTLPSLAAVEVYRSPAEIPTEYDVTRGSDDDLCGIILFWTRTGR